MTDKFGSLENVSLREAWPHEAREFTPWLARNLDRLTDAIGIKLELVQTEAAVGQFSADILARNSADGSVVLIENQLDRSDHRHLGQIMTYLAGHDAQTVIWVARDFRDEHLSAVQWLNENTLEFFNCFAVQIKVVKLGDSPLVPIFEVLERPVKRYRRIDPASRESGGGRDAISRVHPSFWTYYSKRHPDDRILIDPKTGNVHHRFEDARLNITQYVNQGSVGLWLDKIDCTDTPQSATALIDYYRPAIVQALGLNPGQLGSSASIYWQVNVRDYNNWPDAVDWLHKRLQTYRRVLENTPA